MTLSIFSVFIVIQVYLSLFVDMSNAEFFLKYGLMQSAHFEAKSTKKLERRYEKCVAKFNSLDRNVLTDQIPTNMDIPSHPGFKVGTGGSLFKNIKFWPENKVPTEFDESVKTLFGERLACAVMYFHLKTCIRFIKKRNDHENYLFITNGIQCISEEVGMKGGKQIVSFDGSPECMRHGTIVHELMHVIGLFHEHQRHDRDKHIDIFYGNIPLSEMQQYQIIMGYQNYRDIGKYDFSSVMHYGSRFGDDRVMVAKYSKYKTKAFEYTEQMGNREQPTDTDTSKVNELYQCGRTTTTTTATTRLTTTTMATTTAMTSTTTTTSTTTITTKKPVVTNRSIKVLLIGGIGSSSSMEYYYLSQSQQYNSLINVTMIKPRYSHTSVVMNDGKIMTMGGYYDDDQLKNVEIFNPITNTLTKGRNMNKARSGCDSAIINGIVYVCGGYDGKNTLSSCESYQSGVWEYIAQMHKVRNKLRLISLNGYLYAIGGEESIFNRLNSVEKYNPKSNSWMMVKSMQIPRAGHGAAVLNWFIYVCGGHFTNSCERYYEWSLMNKWSNITKTIIHRSSELRMVSDGHHLFAFGGFNDYAKYSVEMYDPKKDKWILLKKRLIHKRWLSSAVVLH